MSEGKEPKVDATAAGSARPGCGRNRKKAVAIHCRGVSMNLSTTRRAFALGLASSSLLKVTGTAEAAATRSGLSWKSGWCRAKLDEFERWRDRAADTYTCWTRHRTWDDILSFPTGGFAALKDKPGQISWGFAMLPESHRGMLNLAAGGTFDGYYKRMAQKLADTGRMNVIIRIGWEGNHSGFPWYGGSNPAAFAAAFRRIAGIMRRYNPSVLIEWNMLKKGKQSGSVAALYPGDDHVDIIGVDLYNCYPYVKSASDWSRGNFRREVQRRARGQRRSRAAGPQAPLTPCLSLPA